MEDSFERCEIASSPGDRTNLGIWGLDLNVTALPITNDTGPGFPREYQRCGSADKQDQADDQTQEWFFQLRVNWITLLAQAGPYIQQGNNPTLVSFTPLTAGT